MVKKSEFIWNTIASISASALSAVLLLITTRINGVDDAGMFSIAFASATVLNAIADYGMRVFQVTDTERKYGFDVYLSARWVVVMLMMAVALIYTFFSGYTPMKAAVCICLTGFRFVDALSETFQGEFQLNNRLDIAGKSVFFRMAASISVFLAVDGMTRNILISCLAMVAANLIVMCVFDVKLIKNYVKLSISRETGAIKKVLLECFPLFFSTFLNLYIINAPKYAIDRMLSYEMQTYFNILYLPTFTINLMSIFVLKPMLLSLGIMWNEKKYKKFGGIIAKMALSIVVLTFVVEAGSALIGIPLLSIIFGVNLEPFKSSLLILILSGGFSALSVVLFYALTTMRCQKKVSLAYIAAAVAGFILPGIMVSAYKITGAAISSVLISIILFLGLLIIFIYEGKRQIKK